MPAIVELDGRGDAGAGEHFVVASGGVTAHLGPLLNVFHLYPENGALDALKAHIETLEFVMVFLFGTPVTQHTDLAGIFRIAGNDHAAFASCAQILAGIEGEACEIANRAGATAIVFRAMRLAKARPE